MTIITFKLDSKLFIKDPQNSELGQRIIQESIRMMDKMGFEQFTFKKLAEKIDSTEASIYRYFENKHRLLLYLIDWYWTWTEYRIDFNLSNLTDPKEKLRICLQLLSEENKFDNQIPFVDEVVLQRIVVSEFEKTYLTKNVDQDNKEGLFLPYKALCNKITMIITELNPQFTYPKALVSTLMLAITHQLYYAEHLPSLTEIKHNSRRHRQELLGFLEHLVTKTITV